MGCRQLKATRSAGVPRSGPQVYPAVMSSLEIGIFISLAGVAFAYWSALQLAQSRGLLRKTEKRLIVGFSLLGFSLVGISAAFPGEHPLKPIVTEVGSVLMTAGLAQFLVLGGLRRDNASVSPAEPPPHR